MKKLYLILKVTISTLGALNIYIENASFPPFQTPLNLCPCFRHLKPISVSVQALAPPPPPPPNPRLSLPLFVSPNPLMLSVVNGLASCFKAAKAECKF